LLLTFAMKQYRIRSYVLVPPMLRVLLSCLLLLPIAAFPQIPLGIGEWRIHVPYKNVTSLTDAGDRIYLSANVFFFSYDKETGSLRQYDKVTGLSDVGVSLVSYNPFNKTLLVVYENTNIDLIRNNTIINISDIKRKQIVGEKKIYSVYFSGNLAYLASSFGIIVMDMDKVEIKDTWRIGNNGAAKKVFSFTEDNTKFYAATEEGLKSASKNSPNLANYAEWSFETGLPAKSTNQVTFFEGQIFASVNDTLYKNDGVAWNYFYSHPKWEIINLTAANKKLTICEVNESNGFAGRTLLVGDDFVCCDTSLYQPEIRNPFQAYVDTDGTAWIADFLNGLIKVQNGTIYPPIYPQGLSATTKVQNISVESGIVGVAPGGSGYTGSPVNRDGFFVFEDNWWKTYNEFNAPALIDYLSLYDVAAHPTQNKIYYGSWWGGLVEFSDGSITVYNKDNSALEGVTGDTVRTIVGGLAFDSNENLWMTSFGSPKPLVVKNAEGTWGAYSVFGIDENGLTQIIVDDYDQKWITVPKSNNQGIYVFKEPNFSKILRSGQGAGNLPTNDVLCLAKDLEGEIWAGTAQGVAVFYCPSSVLTQDGCEAQQIIVTVNGVAGYLLETERVNTIAIDGANRKWVGTNNGVFVLSPDGTEQIAYYTVDNSPLLSNGITDIAIDGQSGEVFIGTDKGLVSLRGEAIEGSEEHSGVLVFPNPVRENYQGPIAIKGLANNANVKITDVSGMLFYETTALGGQAVWDGRNYNGERAKTGVYFVFTSNDDGSSKNVAKLLIIN